MIGVQNGYKSVDAMRYPFLQYVQLALVMVVAFARTSCHACIENPSTRRLGPLMVTIVN